jgi:hypothetical protein
MNLKKVALLSGCSLLIISFMVLLWLPVIKVIRILSSLHIPSKPIVTIESDDWGALRGLDFGTNRKSWSHWSQFDCLESAEDVKKLSAVLLRHHDARGRNAVITSNIVFETIAGNWKKKKIRRKKVPENVILSWKRAINENVFYPQLHAMREADEQSILSPDKSVRLKTSPYMVWNGSSYKDLPADRVEKVVLEGQELFHRIFGFKSLSTVPPRLLWGKTTDIAFAKAGIRYVQGERQVQKRRRSYEQVVGERTRSGLVLLAPRINFEPVFNWEKSKPLDGIVKWKTNEIVHKLNSHMPVAISTHRINYVTGHSVSQAEYGLIALDRLLSSLVRNHPDLFFLTSPELGQLLECGYFMDVFNKEIVKIPCFTLGQLICSYWKIGEHTRRNLLLSAMLLIAIFVLWLRQFLPIAPKKRFKKIA